MKKLKNRDIDMEIATELFGYTLFSSIDQYWVELPGEQRAEPLPRYTTKWSDTVKVVERMRQLGYLFKLLSYNDKNICARFYNEDTVTDRDALDLKELPRAICRAALTIVRWDE